jgi:hypothetical protein
MEALPEEGRFIGGMITRKKTPNSLQSVNTYAMGSWELGINS